MAHGMGMKWESSNFHTIMPALATHTHTQKKKQAFKNQYIPSPSQSVPSTETIPSPFVAKHAKRYNNPISWSA